MKPAETPPVELPAAVEPSAAAAAQEPSDAGPLGKKTWTSDQLLRDAKEATIVHGNQVYRLRLTSTGKLILTK